MWLEGWQNVGCRAYTWSTLGREAGRAENSERNGDEEGPRDWHKGKERGRKSQQEDQVTATILKTNGTLDGRQPLE